MSDTKKKRAEIVNQIIKKIGSCGRHFFRDGDVYAEMIIKHNKVYMVNEWNGAVMPIRTKYNMQPKGWHHGGTLWGLTQDFADFIERGGDTNHNNGYGGLYCKHWGYSEDEMRSIQELAKVVGYLN